MATVGTFVGAAMIVLAAPSLALAVLGWRNRGKPAARGYVVAAVGIGGWSATVGAALVLEGLASSCSSRTCSLCS